MGISQTKSRNLKKPLKSGQIALEYPSFETPGAIRIGNSSSSSSSSSEESVSSCCDNYTDAILLVEAHRVPETPLIIAEAPTEHDTRTINTKNARNISEMPLILGDSKLQVKDFC